MQTIRLLEPSTFEPSADEIVVELPPIDEIARCWPIIEPILKRATNRTTAYEPIDVLHLVMTGRMSLILIRDGGRIVAAVVTEVRQFPRRRVLEVLFCGGTGINRWINRLLEVLDAQAKIAGCADIMTYGRKGWLRYGFELDGFVMCRRVGG